MLRIYSVLCISTKWDGAFHIYKIASSKEDAEKQFKKEIENYKMNGYKIEPIKEMTGKDIFINLLVPEYVLQGYDINYEITNKNIDYTITEKGE